jgi:hypothetical protein
MRCAYGASESAYAARETRTRGHASPRQARAQERVRAAQALSPACSLLAARRLSLQMAHEIAEHCHALQTDSSVRCVLLCGDDSAFCAGRDLKDSAAHESQEQKDEYMHAAMRAVQSVAALPVPVIAAVSGAAMGFGVELILAADIVVARPNAMLCLPECALGIFPGAGTAVCAPRASLQPLLRSQEACACSFASAPRILHES